MSTRKFYVVWEGRSPGIYDSWEECKDQIDGFPGARYKAFPSQDAATEAFRGDASEHIGVLKAIASHNPVAVNYSAFPEIILDSIAVDAACSKNPGPVEYRGVDTKTGITLFKVGPLADGTNNIGEFLAIVHALAMTAQQGVATPIYSDSRTALAWVRDRKCKTTLQRTPNNARIFELMRRAESWLQTHSYANKLIKWKTEEWGEIPADFGRK
ncbi:MAG: ribonuclease H family protein [Muribaculaceae bacterium]|nr:ribonuclease H family protein [Muribaculaceae bacterium]